MCLFELLVCFPYISLKPTSAIIFNKNQHLLFPSLAWQNMSLTYMRPCIDPNMHTIEDQYLTSHLLSTGIPGKVNLWGKILPPKINFFVICIKPTYLPQYLTKGFFKKEMQVTHKRNYCWNPKGFKIYSSLRFLFFEEKCLKYCPTHCRRKVRKETETGVWTKHRHDGTAF